MKLKILTACVIVLSAPHIVQAADATAMQCGAWLEQYNIVPYSSWGSTPSDVQSLWDAKDCNHNVCQYFKDKYGVTPYQSWGNLPASYQAIWDNKQVDCNNHQTPSQPAATPSADFDISSQCGAWLETYSITPYKSWGSAESNVQAAWDKYDCNHKICQYFKNKFGVTPYQSWGSLPSYYQAIWDTPQVDCNHHVN